VVAVQDQDVAIAVTVGPALNGGIGRDRVGAEITFIGVGKGDRDERLGAGDVYMGNAYRRAGAGWPVARSKIGVDGVICTDGGDICVRVGVEGESVYRRVPDVVGRKDVAAGYLGWGLSVGFAVKSKLLGSRNWTR
jgi:hypothetical protein